MAAAADCSACLADSDTTSSRMICLSHAHDLGVGGLIKSADARRRMALILVHTDGESVSRDGYRVGMDDLEDLEQLGASVIEFAAREQLTVVPAVPQHDYGPEVCLGVDVLGLTGFLTLARQLGGGVLYLEAAPFEPDSTRESHEDPPAHLLKYKGRIGQVSVAFAANSVVHFWEHRTAWYREWHDLAVDPASRPGGEEDDEAWQRSQEEVERLAGELADAIVADPGFRSAQRNRRQDVARQVIPKGTESSVAWHAVHQAMAQVDRMALERYEQLDDRLDELATELLASPEYQRASSPGGRKQVAERFLVPHGDGFRPPPRVRDELYARAQQLARQRNGRGLF